MNVTIVGTGYVGLVTGTCLAEVGNHVLCIDQDSAKIRLLNDGRIPIYEPGLEPLVKGNVQAGRLEFSADIARGVAHGEVIIIAVGTPADEDGSADLSHVLAVASSIGAHLEADRVVVTKSTVPVGTAEQVRSAVRTELDRRGLAVSFSVVSNPEFLKEGAAVEDFLKPDRIVVGAADDRAVQAMRSLYAPFNRSHDRMLIMDIRSAELTKYAANAMLATKISFMNEMANLAERLGANIESVRHGIGSDPRIGYQFIYPGCGYGGSCFPKDVRALQASAAENGFETRILDAVQTVNNDQKHLLGKKLKNHFNGNLEGRAIALWGLAFKPETDDMREAPSGVLIEDLWAAGASVRAFDPAAAEAARRLYGERDDLVVESEDPYRILAGADGLVLATEWKMFRSPDFERIAALLAGDVVVDGRNIFDPQAARAAGLCYYGIGHG